MIIHEFSMEICTQSRRRHFQDSVFVWDKRFSVRREDAYHAESNKLKSDDQQSTLTAFIAHFGSRLDPPQYSYAALREFLEEADEDLLKANLPPIQNEWTNILLDDRRDNTGWQDVSGRRHLARDWNSYAGGYPPSGKGIVSEIMNAGQLFRKQLGSVSWSFYVSRPSKLPLTDNRSSKKVQSGVYCEFADSNPGVFIEILEIHLRSVVDVCAGAGLNDSSIPGARVTRFPTEIRLLSCIPRGFYGKCASCEGTFP